MEIPKDMAWCFTTGEYYEKNVIHWLDKIIKNSQHPVIYDIGANIGFYSIRFSPYAKCIYAFEPASKTFTILNKNISRNCLSNIQTFKLGVSNENSLLSINLYSSSGNNSLYLRDIPKGHSLKYKGKENVKVIKLDEFIKEKALLPPDIIKIDIEGAELYALQGAREVIAKYAPIIVMECAETTCRDAGYTKKQLLDELEQFHYSIYGLAEDVDDLNLYSVTEFQNNAIANVIAIPKGQSLE